MEATRNREPLDCPFCVFCSHDHYELLFHVETVHPESTPPSLGPHEQASEDPCGEEAGTKDSIPEDSPVKDPDFIECQCGEFCLVAEFESHLEMHYAESMNFDEVQSSPSNPAVQESTLHHGKASSTNVEIPLTSPSKAAVSKSQDFASRRTPAHRTSQSDGRKSQGLVQDFIDVLRYSTAPPSRRTSRSKSRKAAQRLGVSGI